MTKSRLEALKDFLAAEPDDSFTRYALALEYIALDDFEEGERLLRETVERNPSYVAAYHQLGQLLFKLGRKAEAREAYTKGITAAQSIRDHHAASEMQMEMDEIDEEE